MGKQYNKVQKRKRLLAYKSRKKVRAKEAAAATKASRSK